MKKFMLFWIIGSVASLYATFVIQNLWNWFATSAFHVPAMSFWVTYGLVLLIGLFTNTAQEGPALEDDLREKRMDIVLAALIPDARREEVKAQLEEQTQTGIWMEAGLHVFGKLVGTTFVLALGFVVHAFLS